MVRDSRDESKPEEVKASHTLGGAGKDRRGYLLFAPTNFFEVSETLFASTHFTSFR